MKGTEVGEWTLLPLLELTGAIDDEGNVLAVLLRLDGDTFRRGFDVPDLRPDRWQHPMGRADMRFEHRVGDYLAAEATRNPFWPLCGKWQRQVVHSIQAVQSRWRRQAS
jgi:hypothetical protein